MVGKAQRAASFLGLVLAFGAFSATTACTSSQGTSPSLGEDASSDGSMADAGPDAPGDASVDTAADTTADTTTDGTTEATSEAGICPGGFASCSGICVDPKTDPGNCGSCGKKCTAGDVCSNGQCSLTCGGGTTQCGASCIDTNVDPNNCGMCGHVCPTGQLCSAGQCATQCGGGLSTCPGTAGDGGATSLCVDEQNDPNHCGGCSTVCPTGYACSGGQCSVACPGTEINCNGLCIDPSSDGQYCGATGACGVGDAGSPGTQCPSGEVCNNGSCSVTCPGDEINCGGKCVDPASDPQHCGATTGCGLGDAGSAGSACPSGQVCNGGTCSVSCPGSQVNCNGTCVDPSTSNQHCGATAGCGTGGTGSSGTACPSGQVCNGGTCSVSCPGTEVNCNGTCVDPSTSNQHCGVGAGCMGGTSCSSGQVCSGGTCSVSCPGTEINCNGGCIDPSTSNQHCGATTGCGNGSGSAGAACPSGEVCGNGQCSVSCPGNEIDCGGTCIDPTSSNRYCGATAGCGTGGNGSAGQNCTLTNEVCTNNGCAVSCPGNEINCNGTCVDPSSNNQYCGATFGCGSGGIGSAGTNCLASGEVCAAGACSVTCPSNEVNCGGTCIDPNKSDVHCDATPGCGINGMGSGGINCQSQGLVCGGPSGCSVSCPAQEINCGGLCIDPGSNTLHCGATAGCGTNGAGSAGSVCAAGGVCTGGQCGCPGNEVVCNGKCIDPTTDNTHCGATTGCGVNGQGNAGSNCTNMGEVCTASGCAVTCPGSEINCGGQCINPQTSNQYCGATTGCGVNGQGSAGKNCTTLGEVCTATGCQVTCPGNEVNCGGTCVDPTTSAVHCGATSGCGAGSGSAGTNCQASGEVCNGMGGCTPTCPSPEINCGGLCIDPTSNAQYCGATAGCGAGDAGTAGTNCQAMGEVCNGMGACTSACSGNEIKCGGTCIDPSSNPQYCGATTGCGVAGMGSSGKACGPYANATAVCANGNCGEVCSSGYSDCSGTGTAGCNTNTQTDPNNCGTCGHVCPSNCGGMQQQCQAGACVAPKLASSFSGASAGGDGWAVALTCTQVFNVFHHDNALVINCHNQSDASTCSGYPKTITGLNGGFDSSGQPGMYVDQATDYLYVPAVQQSDGTGGVVCIDTTSSSSNPFCGFVPLTPTGQAPPTPGWGMLSDPVQVGSKWYIFNYFNGTPTGAEDHLLCFDLTTKSACTGQPFAVNLGGSSFSVGAPPTGIAAIGHQIIIPINVSGSSGTTLGCYDPTVAGGTCAGSWPVNTGIGYFNVYGAAFPLLDSTAALTGFCLPTGSDPCFNLSGAPVSTPPGLTGVVGGSDVWNGPAVTVGTRVFVPNGNSNGVECFDYNTDAACTGVGANKTFSNLGYLYTVNVDPDRPTCLWVNSDNGAAQIQNFDAITGAACQ